MYTRVGQNVSNLGFFNAFIIRQAHVPPKVQNKQTFADPCKNWQRNLNYVQFFKTAQWEIESQLFAVKFLQYVEVLQNKTSRTHWNLLFLNHCTFQILILLFWNCAKNVQRHKKGQIWKHTFQISFRKLSNC